MSTVVGIGDDSALAGFALAGVQVIVASTDAEITSAWEHLDGLVGLVILSRRAAAVLAGDLDRHSERLTVAMP